MGAPDTVDLVLTFGLGLLLGCIAGFVWGAHRQEQHDAAARDRTR